MEKLDKASCVLPPAFGDFSLGFFLTKGWISPEQIAEAVSVWQGKPGLKPSKHHGPVPPNAQQAHTRRRLINTGRNAVSDVWGMGTGDLLASTRPHSDAGGVG